MVHLKGDTGNGIIVIAEYDDAEKFHTLVKNDFPDGFRKHRRSICISEIYTDFEMVWWKTRSVGRSREFTVLDTLKSSLCRIFFSGKSQRKAEVMKSYRSIPQAENVEIKRHCGISERVKKYDIDYAVKKKQIAILSCFLQVGENVEDFKRAFREFAMKNKVNRLKLPKWRSPDNRSMIWQSRFHEPKKRKSPWYSWNDALRDYRILRKIKTCPQ